MDQTCTFGYTAKRIHNASSVTALRRYYAGAALDEELFVLLSHRKSRIQLRFVLIQTYFSPDTHPVLLAQGVVNYESYRYSKELLRVAEEPAAFTLGLAGEDQKRIRIRKILRGTAKKSF